MFAFSQSKARTSMEQISTRPGQAKASAGGT